MNQQATRADLNTLQASLHQELASKADIAALESKLRQELASKEDIAALESKLRQELMSKKDFKAAILKISLEFDKTNSRMDSLQEEMRTEFRHINGRFDAFLGKMETYDRESKTIPNTLDEHGKQLRDHERRLNELESNRPRN